MSAGLLRRAFRTPGGNVAEMLYRPETNDFNTLASCMDADEYRLRGLPTPPGGLFLDVGAHIGGVIVAAALDFPEAVVVAVEAVPENVALLRLNAERNGVGRRVRVVGAIAGPPGAATATLWRGFRDAAGGLDHHAWIGLTSYGYRTRGSAACEETTAPVVPLAELLLTYGRVGGYAFAKVDIEGAEYAFLSDLAAVAALTEVRGEWHPVPLPEDGRVAGRGDLLRCFPGHAVTFTGPEGGPGSFTATRALVP